LKDDYNIAGYLDITVAKLELLLNNAPKSVDININSMTNGFRLSRNYRGVDIFTPDENLFKDWKKVLNYRTV